MEQRNNKKRIYNIYETIVKSALLYGTETWRTTGKHKKKEMDAIRGSLCISKRERVRNELIIPRMGIEGYVIQGINIKHLTWYGHVQRMLSISTTKDGSRVATNRKKRKKKT